MTTTRHPDRTPATEVAMTPQELRRTLAGAWSLVSYQATDVETGGVVEPYGPHPRGLIMYTQNGRMAAQIMNPGRPRFQKERPEEGLPEELATAAVGYLAYGGSYEVSEGGLVSHHVELSLFPNWVGTTLNRIATLDGTTLRLAFPRPAPVWGTLRSGVLVWERTR